MFYIKLQHPIYRIQICQDVNNRERAGLKCVIYKKNNNKKKLLTHFRDYCKAALRKLGFVSGFCVVGLLTDNEC